MQLGHGLGAKRFTPVASDRLALRFAAIDIANRLGRAAISAAFTLAAADKLAEALAEALAAALAEAEALAAKAAATLALIVPKSAASCDMAKALSKSRPSIFFASDSAVICARSGPRFGIGSTG